MKIFISCLFSIVFLSGQAFAHNCLGDCSREKSKTEDSKSSAHDCCKEKSSVQTENMDHQCGTQECLQTEETEYQWVHLGSDSPANELDRLALKSNEFLLANLSPDLIIRGGQDIWRNSLKVPLYLSLQKLLLP